METEGKCKCEVGRDVADERSEIRLTDQRPRQGKVLLSRGELPILATRPPPTHLDGGKEH